MAASAHSAVERPSWSRDLLVLALVFGALLFFRLGSYPLSNPDEGRNAEIPREMIVSGDWVTPRLNGVNYFEKPPLVYWASIVAQRTLGANEWAVRGVPALFALLGILITYAAARALYDRTTGLLSALVLGTCLLWFVIGHIPILDIPMATWMSASLFCFLLGVRCEPGVRRRWLFMGLYACAALATLTKGLMGFLVSGAVMFLWLLVFHQWRRLRPLYLPTGVLLFLAIALPWHLLAAQRNETWVHRYIVFEHFLRFLTPAASRPGPWHFFLWVMAIGLFPWTGFLWPRVRDTLRDWKRRSEHTDTWYLITWVAFVVFFFSISKSKLPPYILPVFPALAVLVGRELAAAWRDPSSPRATAGLRTFAVLAALVGLAAGFVVLRPETVRMDEEQAAALRPYVAVVALALAAGAAFTLVLHVRRRLRTAIAVVAGTMATLYVTLATAAPLLNKPSTKELALYVKAHASPDDLVYHVYDLYQDFTFYAERLVGIVGSNTAELELEEDAAARASGRFISDTALLQSWAGPRRIYLVVQQRKIEQIKRSHAENLAAWEKRATAARAAGTAFTEDAPETPIFAAPGFQYHLIAQTPTYYLLSNRP